VANKTVNGTNFSETLWGSEDSDFFQPYSGDDIIYGGGGNDEINAYYNDEKGRLFSLLMERSQSMPALEMI
tara:strand:- start:348 stop:560 length:213 start_codon:yes stop_codon:yes gene_type:complete